MKVIGTMAAMLFCIIQLVMARQQSLGNKQNITIHSKAENTDHDLVVQLPQSYGRTKTAYPVIVLLDAHDPSLLEYTSATVDRLMGSGDIPDAIFVGVLQKERSKELGVERSESTSALFLQFISDEFTAWIKQQYTVSDYYTFIGHSLGGQFLTNALTVRPDVFRSVISISGALNYKANEPEYSFYKRKVLTRMEAYLQQPEHAFRQKYYFSVGSEGFQDLLFRQGALTLDSMLRSKQAGFLDWHFDYCKGFNHMTTPVAGIPAGLIYIYKDWHFREELAMDALLYKKADPLEALNGQLTQIKKVYGTDVALPRFIYYQFAHFYLEAKKYSQARTVTRMLVALRPDDDGPYALLGEILSAEGDKKAAIEQYQLAQARSSKEKYQAKIAALLPAQP